MLGTPAYADGVSGRCFDISNNNMNSPKCADFNFLPTDHWAMEFDINPATNVDAPIMGCRNGSIAWYWEILRGPQVQDQDGNWIQLHNVFSLCGTYYAEAIQRNVWSHVLVDCNAGVWTVKVNDVIVHGYGGDHCGVVDTTGCQFNFTAPGYGFLIDEIKLSKFNW